MPTAGRGLLRSERDLDGVAAEAETGAWSEARTEMTADIDPWQRAMSGSGPKA